MRAGSVEFFAIFEIKISLDTVGVARSLSEVVNGNQ